MLNKGQSQAQTGISRRKFVLHAQERIKYSWSGVTFGMSVALSDVLLLIEKDPVRIHLSKTVDPGASCFGVSVVGTEGTASKLSPRSSGGDVVQT